jgi:hypothetical protein
MTTVIKVKKPFPELQQQPALQQSMFDETINDIFVELLF